MYISISSLSFFHSIVIEIQTELENRRYASLLTTENSKNILQGVCSKYIIRNTFYAMYSVYRKLFTATRKCVYNANLFIVMYCKNIIMYQHHVYWRAKRQLIAKLQIKLHLSSNLLTNLGLCLGFKAVKIFLNQITIVLDFNQLIHDI